MTELWPWVCGHNFLADPVVNVFHTINSWLCNTWVLEGPTLRRGTFIWKSSSFLPRRAGSSCGSMPRSQSAQVSRTATIILKQTHSQSACISHIAANQQLSTNYSQSACISCTAANQQLCMYSQSACISHIAANQQLSSYSQSACISCTAANQQLFIYSQSAWSFVILLWISDNLCYIQMAGFLWVAFTL